MEESGTSGDGAPRSIAEGEWKVFRKAYSHDDDGEVARKKLKTIWMERGLLTEKGQGAFNDLMGVTAFQAPKPVELLKTIVQLGTEPRGDDLVLDFFAGSGTTAQAVLELNKEDGGNRRFVLVQLPEPTGREDFPTIADITKERVRRVIQRMEGGAPSPPVPPVPRQPELGLNAVESGRGTGADGAAPSTLGFKVFKLAESNFAIWNPELAATTPEALAEQWKLSADNVSADATEISLLYELMLKSGLPLHSPALPHDADGARVWLLDSGRKLICLARDLTREQLRAMIDLKPLSVLCLDIAFKGNDALKVNADLEFQSHGIQFATA